MSVRRIERLLSVERSYGPPFMQPTIIRSAIVPGRPTNPVHLFLYVRFAIHAPYGTMLLILFEQAIHVMTLSAIS